MARSCARFGISYRHTGSRETRLLKAMLKINRDEGRPATARELAAAAEISSGGGGQVALSLRDAQGRGWFVKIRPGLYVITEAGEKELAR